MRLTRIVALAVAVAVASGCGAKTNPLQAKTEEALVEYFHGSVDGADCSGTNLAGGLPDSPPWTNKGTTFFFCVLTSGDSFVTSKLIAADSYGWMEVK